MDHLVLYCRPGFEPELAGEILDRASQLNVGGYPKTEKGSGFVVFCTYQSDGASVLIAELDFKELIFARQWFASNGLLEGLSTKDRIIPLIEAMKAFPQAGELVIETADTNDAKQLAGFCRKFTSPCAAALRKQGVLAQKRNRKQPRLHLFFTATDSVYPGISYPDNSAAEPMGILRLKFPADAPSRSTLKLEEAWKWFIPARKEDTLLAPGMTAVDLGAAPGGWTYQLVKKHMRVAAVDNGPMRGDLMDSGLVTHEQVDGFKYRPARTVDWLVCDMAEKPSRVAALMAEWFVDGDCRQAIFNLKLPMKKRYQAVLEAEDIIHQQLEAAGVQYRLSIKHLYHDREEVTCYLRLR